MDNKKGQLNISFGWLFAIIVGATILVLVIFGVTKIVKTSQQEQQALFQLEKERFFQNLKVILKGLKRMN